MSKRISLTAMWRRVVEVHYADPDRSRRAVTLNMLLAALGLITILALAFTVAMEIAGVFPPSETRIIYVPVAVLAIAIIGIYALNHVRSYLAGTIFLTLLVILLALSDDPAQVADGRGQLMFAIPIIMASIVLPAWTTFLFAGLVSAAVIITGFTVGIVFTPFAPFAYFIIALVSYLGAAQLQSALNGLRRINEELDHRVEERTRELSETNRQLENANERLRELDQLKSRFLSMVSHELRTPLSAIQGFAEILLAEIYGAVTPAQRNALERITNNTTRMLSLVGDLLDRARIEAGQLALHTHPFSPYELVQDVYSTLNIIAQSRGLMLVAEIDPDLPPQIEGDESRLRQVLVNLVNNALKFTEVGSVTIKLTGHNGGGAPPGPDQWLLAVSDTGAGIAPKDQAYIFEPFRRVDDSTTRKEVGVGLGLSIVKDLVELMQGTITLHSEVGKGSTFSILLPLLTGEEQIRE